MATFFTFSEALARPGIHCAWFHWNRTLAHCVASKFQNQGTEPATEVAFLLLTQQPRVQVLAFQKNYFDVAEIYLCSWLEESGQ